MQRSSYVSNYFNRTSSGGNVGLLLSKNTSAPPPGLQTADQGSDFTTANFIPNMLAQSQSLVWDTSPYNAPSGSTNVRIYRIFAPDTGGISITPN